MKIGLVVLVAQMSLEQEVSIGLDLGQALKKVYTSPSHHHQIQRITLHSWLLTNVHLWWSQIIFIFTDSWSTYFTFHIYYSHSNQDDDVCSVDKWFWGAFLLIYFLNHRSDISHRQCDSIRQIAIETKQMSPPPTINCSTSQKPKNEQESFDWNVKSRNW